MIDFFKKHTVIIFLLLIFSVAVCLRFYSLSEIPNGLHIDEAINGVNGYFISQTGKDTNNNLLPLQTEVFGDYNPTGYSYLAILPIKLFGLNEFSTRFPGALLGCLTVLATFLLGFAIFRNKKIGLLSAFLVAISPWHIVFSRSSEETLVSLFFVVLGFALAILSFEHQKLKLLFSGISLLFLSFFMYFTPRVFVPLLFFALLILLFSNWHKQKNMKYKNVFVGSFLFLVALALILVFIVNGGGNRFKQVSVFGSPETRLIMEEQIREDGVMGTSVKITQMFHNKVTNYLLTYASNYIDYFSGSFLFMKGGLPVWFRVEGIGLVYVLELPFLLIGLVVLATSKNKMQKIPLIWLFLAPVVAAVTTDDIPNIRRSLTMLPIIEIISAFGFLYVIQNRKKLGKTMMIFVSAILLTLNFSYFLHQYFVHAPVHRNWYRNEGFGEMVKTVKNSYNEIDKIIVTKSAGGIYPIILFYMQYDPKDYLLEGSIKDREYTGFGKFFFVSQTCPSQKKDHRFPKVKKAIYVDKGECKNSDRHYKTIYRKDGTKVFNVVYE